MMSETIQIIRDCVKMDTVLSVGRAIQLVELSADVLGAQAQEAIYSYLRNVEICLLSDAGLLD